MKIIQTTNAPAAVGPYSQAIEANGFIFCSGQLGLDPVTGVMVEGGVIAQLKQLLKNIEAVLEESGVLKTNIVKTTIFLTDINDFAAVNEEYAAFFGEHKPARSTVQVAKLPKDGLIEIEVVAVK